MKWADLYGPPPEKTDLSTLSTGQPGVAPPCGRAINEPPPPIRGFRCYSAGRNRYHSVELPATGTRNTMPTAEESTCTTIAPSVAMRKR